MYLCSRVKPPTFWHWGKAVSLIKANCSPLTIEGKKQNNKLTVDYLFIVSPSTLLMLLTMYFTIRKSNIFLKERKQER